MLEILAKLLGDKLKRREKANIMQPCCTNVQQIHKATYEFVEIIFITKTSSNNLSDKLPLVERPTTMTFNVFSDLDFVKFWNDLEIFT